MEGNTIISGAGEAVGAPHLVLNPRLGSRLRNWETHPNFVLASVGTTPPVILFSLYLPAHSTHGSSPFERVWEEFNQKLQEMQAHRPGSFVLGGADCNTQLRVQPGQVGGYNGANERPHDQERADLLLGTLAALGLTAPTSYHNLGPTRFPWPGQLPRQHPSVIDYIFASHQLHTKVHTTNPPQPATSTDHIPIGLTAHAPHRSRKDRRAQFEKLLSRNRQRKRRLPTNWAPGNNTDIYLKLRTHRFHSLSEVAPVLLDTACSQDSAADKSQAKKQQLFTGIRRAQDPLVRQAYQIELREFRRQQRETRETSKILSWARGDSWTFSKQTRMPATLRYPNTLDGEADRGKWGQKMGDYLRELYTCSTDEAQRTHDALWRIQTQAHRSHEPPLDCNPTELRDIVRDLPPNKAAGPDGVPSQLLKLLSFNQIKDIASLFTALANSLEYTPLERPDSWHDTLATLLPKEINATTLAKHRAIALMCQLQKLYSRWLMTQMVSLLDQRISQAQHGFRRQRQASEIMQVVGKLIEMALEWKRPLTIVRIDIKKAFDRIHQSAILETLESSALPRKVVFNAARELVGSRMTPHLYGCTTEEPIELQQGTKQGAPESGLFFIATLDQAMAQTTRAWDERSEGCELGGKRINHLLFADDLLLVNTNPHKALRMFREIEPALQKIGLQVNPEKTAYLTTMPQQAQMLPGTNANDEGLKILGRTFALRDNTPQEMTKKIGIAWGRFNKIRHILRAQTPLPHRLRIFKSCIGQALLWGSESWHITRQRLQRIRGVELAMMRTLIPSPKFPKDTPTAQRYEQHKSLIRTTLKTHKYEGFDRQWVRRYHAWAGHLARLPAERWAKRAMQERNLAWWRTQQAIPTGYRHHKREGNISRWENQLGRHHPNHTQWPENARYRDRWQASFPVFEQRVFWTSLPA